MMFGENQSNEAQLCQYTWKRMILVDITKTLQKKIISNISIFDLYDKVSDIRIGFY